MSKNYYDVLGVSKNFTEQELKQAYKKAAMKYHPDRHRNASAAEQKQASEQFNEVATAYSVLSNPEDRRKYDMGYDPTQRQSGDGMFRRSHFSPEELFAQFFSAGDDPFGDSGFGDMFFHSSGRSSRTQQQRPSTPAPFEVDLVVTLEQLFSGTVKKLKITRTRFQNNRQIREDHYCEIKVKPGWKDKTRITFSGEGDQLHPNGRAGDLVFSVKTKPHVRFTREDNNLISVVKIPLRSALCGVDIQFQTIDNRLIPLVIDDIVTPQYRHVVRGMGMPSSKLGVSPGDLIICFDISFPATMTASQKKAISAALQP